MSVLQTIGDGLGNAFLMAWQVWWALVLGFAISGVARPGCRAPASSTRWPGRARARWRSPPALAQPRRRAPTRPSRSPSRCSRRAHLRVCTRVPVLLDQPRNRARGRDLDPDGVAVHARRVRRRPAADRGDDARCRGCSCRGASSARHASTLRPRRRATNTCPPASRWGCGSASRPSPRGRTSPQLPRRLVDGLEGVAIGFVLAGFIGLLGNDFFNVLFIEHAPRG